MQVRRTRWLWSQKGSSIYITHTSRHLTQQLFKTRNCYGLKHFRRSKGFCNLTSITNGTSLKGGGGESEKETAPPYVLRMTQTQAGKQHFSHFLQFPQKLTCVFVDRRQLKPHSMKLKQTQLRVLLHGPALPNAAPVLSSTACLSSLLPSLYLCTAHNVFSQACQHPSAAEGSCVWIVFSSCFILWFVRTTGECMKCTHMQRRLQAPQTKGRHVYFYEANQRGCNWNFCSKQQTRLPVTPIILEDRQHHPTCSLAKRQEGKNRRTHEGRFLTVQEVVLYPCSAVFQAWDTSIYFHHPWQFLYTLKGLNSLFSVELRAPELLCDEAIERHMLLSQ